MLHYMGKACVQLALVQVTYKLMYSWLLFIAQISYKCIMLLIEGRYGNVDESVKTPLLLTRPCVSRIQYLQIKTVIFLR